MQKYYKFLKLFIDVTNRFQSPLRSVFWGYNQIIFFWSLLAPLTLLHMYFNGTFGGAAVTIIWRHHAKVGTAAFVLRVFSKISLKISPETSVKWDSIRPTELTIKIKRLEKPIKIFDFFFPDFWRTTAHFSVGSRSYITAGCCSRRSSADTDNTRMIIGHPQLLQSI